MGHQLEAEREQEFRSRLARTQAELDRQGLDYLLIGPSPDLVYLIDFAVRQSERLTVLAVPREGTPRLVMPAFELPTIAELPPLFEPVGWKDGESPTERLASVVVDRGRGKGIAVGGEVYTRFLMRIQAAMPDARYVVGDLVLGPVRVRKSPYEVAALRAASESADAVFEAIVGMDLVGQSEREILSHIHRLLIEKGHDTVGGGIVAVGANGASPHHHAGERRVELGEPVVVDFGGVRDSYRSDITRTFHVGPPAEKFRRVYEIVGEANEQAFQAVRPGVTAEAVDTAAREHIAAAGYGDHFLHRTGHGIGLDGKEPPYLVTGDTTVLEEGMAFSIEPGIYLEGEFGVRIEDIVVVTADGGERLNGSTHELQVVGE